MAVIAKVGLVEIRSVGFHLVPLHGWQGPKHCASFNSFPKQLEWKWIGSRATVSRTSTHRILELQEEDLTCYTTTPSPLFLFI